ncbi:MAG TPA: radical SAM protein [Pyrinomonadaceae bacterium]
MNTTTSTTAPDYGERRLSVELTNICNLHCSYCLRDEEALYHTPANFLPVALLEKIVNRAREVMKITHVGFTGGEPTLHPHFEQIVNMCASRGVSVSFVTNGWHFNRVWPTVKAHRDSISTIAFSLDGATQAEHDYWRGEGSFVRLVKALACCYGNGIPFGIKTTLRRDVIPRIEGIALFAARMGASQLTFGHVMPTTTHSEDNEMLTTDQRIQSEQEIANLARIFKMKIALDVGYFNIDPSVPCSPLAGASANVDYRGRLSLCCNLSGYRGAAVAEDVVADLNSEDFSSAYERLSELAVAQTQTRATHLIKLAAAGINPDTYSASPCLFCLDTFGKLPWRHKPESCVTAERSLPVIQACDQAEKINTSVGI